MIKVRPYQPEDFDELCAWWQYHEGDCPERCLLPECSGAVVEDDGVPVAAAFLFMTLGCGTCWIERFVALPGSTTQETRDAGFLIDRFLCKLAKSNGYAAVLSTFSRPAMAREAAKVGFAEMERNVLIMGKPL